MKIALCLGALIILLGYIQFPYSPAPEHAPLWMNAAMVAIFIAPFVPILGVITKFFLRLSISQPIAYGIGALSSVLGLFLTLVSVAFSGAGSALLFWHGLTLTGAVVASVLLLSNRFKLTPKSPSVLVFLCAVLVGAWSLLTVPAIVFQAHKLANGRAYCIAPHRSQADITALSEMRGLTFYTTSSGFKSTSRWYFHGVLLVEENADVLEAYNWSPRRLRFYRIERPRELIRTPLDVCTPRDGFLSRLSAF